MAGERLKMNQRLRITLLLFGLLILAVALWLLAGALLPVGTVTEQVTLAPTLFAVP